MILSSFITNYLEPFACFVYLVALLIYYRKQKQAGVSSLLGYYILSAVLLSFGAFSVGKTKAGNIWVYDLVLLFTALLIGLYFYHILQSRAKKRTVIALTVAFLAYAIYRHLSVAELRLFDSIGYSIVSASVVIYVFMYFHQLLKNVTETSLLREFNFWVASSYLLYYVGSFIIFLSYYYFTNRLFANYSRKDQELLTALWGLHNVLLFAGALSLLIGSLWVVYPRKST